MKKIGFLFSLVLLVSAQSVTAQDNPFRHGVNREPLKVEEKQSLLEWVNKAKTILEDALRRAKGKSLQEAGNIYMNAIRVAVLESYNGSRRGELLMRYVLSQALDLTYGIPTANGQTFETRGVLNGTVQADLIAIVLEDSIRLALKVIPADLRCIQKDSLVDLPFGEVAASRIVLARRWMASTFEWTGAYDLAVAALRHWFVTVSDQDNLHKFADASLILEVNDLLQIEMVGKRYNNSEELVSRVRELRGMLRRVSTSVSSAAKFVPGMNPDDKEKAEEVSMDFGGGGSRLSVEQTIQVAAKMNDVSKSNAIILSFFRKEINVLTLSDISKLRAGLFEYNSDYKEANNENSKLVVTLAMYREYASYLIKHSQGTSMDLSFFRMARGWIYSPGDFNSSLESYLNQFVAKITFADLETGIDILRVYNTEYKENNNSDSYISVKTRLIDKWYALNK